MSIQSPCKVVVIGAGLAGVTAAASLLHNGVTDVTVLEAQDYVGGRIKAAYHNNTAVDLGAQFIHGRVGNPLFEIADKLGRVAFPDDNNISDGLANYSLYFFTSAGQVVERSEVVDLIQSLNTLVDDTASGAIEDDDKYIGMSTLKAAVTKTYHDFLHAQPQMSPQKRELYDAALTWYCKYLCVDNAVEDLSEVSLNDEYLDLPGDRFTDVEGGMASILSSVVDLLPPGTIQLNTPVARVCWDQTSTPQSQPKDHRRVEVTCQNGDVITADHVIVTISMGCLKSEHQRIFHPALPAPTRQGIDRIGFGAIGKVFLFWDEPFWNKIKRSTEYFEMLEFFWLSSHIPIIPRDKSKVLTKNGFPWWYGVFSAETLHGHPNCLEFWLTKDQVEVTEHLDDQEFMHVLTDVLKAFLPNVSIPDPVTMHRTKWLSNPYTKGTFCFHTPELTTEDIENMGKPLPSEREPHLLFAGEGFHHSFMSTAHGAFLSGGEQAARILARHGLKVNNSILDLVSSSSRPEATRDGCPG